MSCLRWNRRTASGFAAAARGLPTHCFSVLSALSIRLKTYQVNQFHARTGSDLCRKHSIHALFHCLKPNSETNKPHRPEHAGAV